MSRASVFRYPATPDQLRTEAAGRVFERFLDLFDLDDSPSPTTQDGDPLMNISNDRPRGRRLHVAGMVLVTSLVAACGGGDEAASESAS